MATAAVTAISAAQEATVAATLGRTSGVRLVRRCADVADLVAICTAGRADVAVLSADFTGLDRSTIGALRAAGVGILGVHQPGVEDEQRVLQQWGVRSQLPIGATPTEFAAAVQSVTEGATSRHTPPDASEDPTVSLEAELAAMSDRAAPYVPVNPWLEAPTAEPGPVVPEQTAKIVTVWGPVGAPGRTVLAVNLAAEAARMGVPTVLVDADTYAASIAQHLALLDEAPGIAAATRLADSGHLDLRSLAAVAPEASPGLRVLTGLPRADRWPEIRDDALEAVLEQCRQLGRLIVVDVAAPLEQDEELSYDTTAPRRNAATLTALAAADTVIAVGSADPVGLQRLVRGLDELRSVIGQPPWVVANMVRASAVGSPPEQRVSEALQRFAGVSSPAIVPDDRAAFDGALLAGRVLAEHAAGSTARKAIASLASDLTGASALTRRGRWGRHRESSPQT
ncbi:pilus biosynthesis protein CpaE [Flexivirga endophytica]|uniref:Pilus biosynthesis protein CpaE n=1 Tax=Flexivirga endophytica TaxID=1849103 RepID=A0A916TCY5_9MICO|nr:chromosome partitioning protein [Flexivirga endophytica]GGB39334.1 pilus biosynthesis protein CpaE [Flexivirga endophytica]GHB47252.1 pilus biosynthesis protein CpaE [Flexivirga endophytica]